jgi:hypothetical protein
MTSFVSMQLESDSLPFENPSRLNRNENYSSYEVADLYSKLN